MANSIVDVKLGSVPNVQSPYDNTVANLMKGASDGIANAGELFQRQMNTLAEQRFKEEQAAQEQANFLKEFQASRNDATATADYRMQDLLGKQKDREMQAKYNADRLAAEIANYDSLASLRNVQKQEVQNEIDRQKLLTDNTNKLKELIQAVPGLQGEEQANALNTIADFKTGREFLSGAEKLIAGLDSYGKVPNITEGIAKEIYAPVLEGKYIDGQLNISDITSKDTAVIDQRLFDYVQQRNRLRSNKAILEDVNRLKATDPILSQIYSNVTAKTEAQNQLDTEYQKQVIAEKTALSKFATDLAKSNVSPTSLIFNNVKELDDRFKRMPVDDFEEQVLPAYRNAISQFPNADNNTKAKVALALQKLITELDVDEEYWGVDDWEIEVPASLGGGELQDLEGAQLINALGLNTDPGYKGAQQSVSDLNTKLTSYQSDIQELDKKYQADIEVIKKRTDLTPENIQKLIEHRTRMYDAGKQNPAENIKRIQTELGRYR